MLKTLEDLLVLQEEDRQLLALRREADDIPKRKTMAEARLVDRRNKLAEAEEARKKNLAAMKQTEMEIESLRDQLNRMLRQQYEVKTNEQYRVLLNEMAAHRESIRRLEDQELELMEKDETLQAEVARARAAVAEAEKECRAESAELDRRAEVIAREIEGRMRRREERAAGIPAEWLTRYHRILQHHGDLAIVPVQGQTCGGCHMVLPPQTVQDVRRDDAMVTCGFCGRLLYWKP